jgi:nucleotide-binding universal stress UspA family protein
MTTTEIKNVLIALDYDPTAQKVADAGYSLAKALGAQVVLMHVISDPVYYSSVEYGPIMGFTGFTDMGLVQPDSIDGLKNASRQFLEKARQHLGDETIQTTVKEGDFAESILKVAKELHTDIIVMGSHSRKWLEDIVMGSVTKDVLHHTTIPLFLVPTRKANL